MENIINFLEKNGFETRAKNVYVKNECTIVINSKSYEVLHDGFIICSPNLNIYWLIGYLTYNGLIDKNYKV